MKICAIICEYNPFHNGHLYQLREAKCRSGADTVLCIMSGNFVQRGEAAILDKYTRAKHAVMAGADAVIELPTVFATSNAELFAKGAIHILASIPQIDTLCFGCESANKTTLKLAAKYLNDEPQEVSNKIKELAASGVSYAKARAQAWAGYIPMDVLCSPNNILGLEYTRAILASQANIDILPIERVGGNYNDESLRENYSSATAIRASFHNKELVQTNVPEFVANDLPLRIENSLDILEKHAILIRNKAEIAKVCDCTEGLENAFKKAASLPKTLQESLTSARYTASRIRRIALQNLLKIEEGFIRECLQASLYLCVLAVKKERSDLLSALSEANSPLLIRAHDEEALQKTAKACYGTDFHANEVYRLLYPNTKTEKNIFI
ncbi:MAG: nucleotidyltransferase family protein [Clostridia bacterium]|nr:nucleotidyltransferase family protein [Clostridia bacterium]